MIAYNQIISNSDDYPQSIIMSMAFMNYSQWLNGVYLNDREVDRSLVDTIDMALIVIYSESL